MFQAPHPRYRIYTRFRSYGWLLADMLAGRLQKGPGIGELEKRLSHDLGVEHVVACSQARLGIYLAVKAHIEPGQSVIMSPYTIADVVNMVICAGGKPVFADIDQRSCNIDPEEVASLLDGDVGLVLATHLHGIPAETTRLVELCRDKGVPLIEDAAQAFGAMQAGKQLGTIGDAGIYSFGMYKNVVSWYGGAVVSNNEATIRKIRAEIKPFRQFPSSILLKKMISGAMTGIATHPLLFQTFTYWVFRHGFLNDIDAINRRVDPELDLSRKTSLPDYYLSNLTPGQARLILDQLDHVDRDSEERIRRVATYRAGLKDIPSLILPPDERNDRKAIYTYFPIQYAERKKLLKFMMRHKRDVAAQHLRNCADLPSFSEFRRDCPRARAAADNVLLLPTYPCYPESEVVKNIDVIRKFFDFT